MPQPQRPDTYQKALHLNLSHDWYGTLAEIGAGQETAQWLFHVGGASGTVAKTMSAYDMKFSDAIYGKAARYVSRERLDQMLNHEYRLLFERLKDQKDGRRFFCFANTIAARSHSHPQPGRGWLGVRFQLNPDDDEPSQIVIHVHLLDLENLHEQQALGIVGINLLYGACILHDQPTELIDSLMDQLNHDRIEIDMIDFTGPVAKDIDNRLMSIELVARGLTDAAMFTAKGENVELADRFHGKPILLQRGTFRPVILPVVRMMELGQQQLCQTVGKDAEPVVVSEMNLQDLELGKEADRSDLLARLEVLQKLGRDVLITDYREHYRLAELLAPYTHQPIVMVMGVPTVHLVFDEQYYDNLSGGLLEAAGRLFKKQVRFYVYPYKDADTGRIVTLHDADLPPSAARLLAYLEDIGAVAAIEPDQSQDLSVFPDQVLEMIRTNHPDWKTKVPDQVAQAIEKNKLFGYQSQKR